MRARAASPPKSGVLSPVNIHLRGVWFAMTKTVQALEAVRTDSDNWEERVRDQVEQGSNFFLILPNDPDAIKRFCAVFELEEDCVRKPLSRSEFLLLSPYVPQSTFDEVINTWENEEQVIFLDQLDFPINKPPRLKSYLVYSPVLGILSQHDGVWEARTALSSYRTAPILPRPQAEAEIYKWNGQQWTLVP